MFSSKSKGFNSLCSFIRQGYLKHNRLPSSHEIRTVVGTTADLAHGAAELLNVFITHNVSKRSRKWGSGLLADWFQFRFPKMGALKMKTILLLRVAFQISVKWTVHAFPADKEDWIWTLRQRMTTIAYLVGPKINCLIYVRTLSDKTFYQQYIELRIIQPWSLQKLSAHVKVHFESLFCNDN